jgi:hypothetical protein
MFEQQEEEVGTIGVSFNIDCRFGERYERDFSLKTGPVGSGFLVFDDIES